MENNARKQQNVQQGETLSAERPAAERPAAERPAAGSPAANHRPASRNRKMIRAITEGAIIAALYVALTMAANALGLANMPIQVRFSEALCVLCFFTPAAIPGMTIGCLLGNLLIGANVWDIAFGPVATLLGMLGGYALGVVARRAAVQGRSRLFTVAKVLIPLPTVISNAVIVPLILMYAYGVPDGYGYLALTVGVGEVISAWILGLLVLGAVENARVFKNR